MAIRKPTAAAAGRADGYTLGREQGLRFGACQAALQRTPIPAVAVRPLRVLFIPQGFDAIDQGIVRGLQQTVAECYVGSAADMARLAEELRPDLMLVMNGLHVFPPDHAEQAERVRALGIRTAIWFVDDPYCTDMSTLLAPHYDYVFTHELGCVSLYRDCGCPASHYLPLAVNPEMYRPMQVSSAYVTDVCFIGNGFPNRIELFDRLAPFLAGKRVLLAGALWERLRRYDLLRQGVKPGWTPIEETVKYYNGAKIVINIHRPTVDSVYNHNSRQLPAYSINPRTYEIAACGALQMTDIRHDLYRYYNAGQDLETFASPEELIEKIRYYLEHEEQRRTIAVNGLHRSLQNHTYAARLTEMLTIMFG
jgi:spore maturation protein CgeB